MFVYFCAAVNELSIFQVAVPWVPEPQKINKRRKKIVLYVIYVLYYLSIIYAKKKHTIFCLNALWRWRI